MELSIDEIKELIFALLDKSDLITAKINKALTSSYKELLENQLESIKKLNDKLTIELDIKERNRFIRHKI